MSYRYFENRDCEYYPCHALDKMNCLFCFCPLYFLEDCGGHFTMIAGASKEAIKDCSHCLIPHKEGGYDYVMEKLKGRRRSEDQHQYYGQEWL